MSYTHTTLQKCPYQSFWDSDLARRIHYKLSFDESSIYFSTSAKCILDSGCVHCLVNPRFPGSPHSLVKSQVWTPMPCPPQFLSLPRLPGRPTKDCLFTDPARDGVSLLKIWNMNKYTGVVGVYNCQGAAWSTVERKNAFHQAHSEEAITGYVRGRDVHLIKEAATEEADWNGDCAVYCNKTGEVVTLPHNAAMPISLKVLEQEIFTVSPIRVLAPGVGFAPLGLVDMYNAGGAIEELRYGEKVVSMEVKGSGRFGVYSSEKPRRCCVGGTEVGFDFDGASGLVTMMLNHMPVEGHRVHIIEVEL